MRALRNNALDSLLPTTYSVQDSAEHHIGRLLKVRSLSIDFFLVNVFRKVFNFNDFRIYIVFDVLRAAKNLSTSNRLHF